MNQDYITEALKKISKELYGDEYKLSVSEHDTLHQILTEQRNQLLEEFRKCVPEEKEHHSHEDEVTENVKDGWNDCRNQILDNIEKL